MSAVDTAKILGFVHIYDTPAGDAILADMLASVKDSGLLTRTTSIEYATAYPEDNPQLYEGVTLKRLWSACVDSYWDGLVWYVHTKGASLPDIKQDSARAWRKEMEKVVILQWGHCIRQFKDDLTLDCYGAHLPVDDRFFFPGNFWWARASHIRSLPNPIDWACGTSGHSQTGDPVNTRYGYEDWITNSKPGTIAKAFDIWNPDGTVMAR